MKDRDLLISAESLHARLADDELRILDCRFDLMEPEAGRAAHLEAHIPGAMYADLNRDLSAPVGPGTGRHPLPDVAECCATMGRLGIGPATSVVVYDDASGALASRAWWILRWLGHEKVALLDGGLRRWSALDYPIEKGAVTVAENQFEGTPNMDLVLETNEIVAARQSAADMRLVDARDAARFHGEREPIDTVAGHIPGAINVPFASSLNEDSTWKEPRDLAVLWHEALEGDLESPWSVMCGSGVTACHNAISGLLAGLPEPRIYVGSWSEWIRDPQRPIATAVAESG